MLIGYSMPPTSNILMNGGAGHAWLSSDAGSACFDHKPARRSRFRWRNDAVPAVGQYVAVRVDVPSTQIRIAAFLGLKNVPAGTEVRVYGQRAADGAPVYTFLGTNIGTVVKFSDGTYGCWFVFSSAAEPVVRVEFRIYNNNAGATWATAVTTVDIGELVAMPAVDVEIESEWEDEQVDPTMTAFSVAAQPNSVRRQAYRTLVAALTVDGVAKVRGGTLANGMDWYALRAAMLGDQRVVAIPRWKTPAGAIDVAELHRTALYGIGRMAASIHAGGDYYGAALRFQEVPATA